jgi:hypothetical protein
VDFDFGEIVDKIKTWFSNTLAKIEVYFKSLTQYEMYAGSSGLDYLVKRGFEVRQRRGMGLQKFKFLNQKFREFLTSAGMSHTNTFTRFL